ncbi:MULTISPECIES: alpha/beta fold hydrolase [Asticcacaulis]|uniref:alpha/beta fold hydrolase n=1 Tax=Asticcacaulis TaxID=76890 RepID=UPI001AEAD580|nr:MULTISPECIES: alpha/beta hydrolase [Asticcacaulis]MBP2161387.1 pimeloyl-ACP methyl ester carboxylesterase [Asticcacaulis solisilvae]MDR6802432.1 pimeloyl-ACP methyl ester carboxylesterase [Asticcacaulis sp. BE141]
MSEPSKKSRKGMPIGVMIVLAIAIAVAVGVGTARSETLRFPSAPEARFSVEVIGSGPDVILIPGLGSSRDVWDATVERYKGQYRLHILNIAGFAGEPAGANATGEVIAPSVEALDAYIKAKKLKAPTVVGHSMGGLMALMLAKAHPDAAGKLVIVDALPFAGVIFNPQATVENMQPMAAMVRDNMINGSADAFAMQQNAGVVRMTISFENQQLVAGWSIASDRGVFARAFYEDMTIDLRPDLKAIQTSTVMIYPYDESVGQTAASTEAFYKAQYTGMTRVSFTGITASRHFVMLDQPDAFLAKLGEALK